MLNGGQHRFRDVIASAIGWWAEAGLDAIVDEQPRDWLAAPAKVTTPAKSPVPAVSATAPAIPDSLDAFHTLLSTGDYAPRPAPPSRRIAPSGTPGAALMIVADMPDADDAAALFTGETGRLFDAMIAAMGLDRARIYIAPFSPARSAGRIAPDEGEALAALMRRHVALAEPRALVVFGDEPARWLFGEDALRARGGLRQFNHDRGTVPAIATFHPRHLRRMPALKASAWADMRLLLGVIGS
ncbi:uracil-DNA glycosylase family protein [Sphingomonas oryzagri]